MTVNVLEIRNYLLKPHHLEHFIDYFEEHFLASQEAVGMSIFGQFRVINEPDHFVWIRGFSDMEARREALQSFYSGPVWAKYGPLANDMMLEWHNVHLLRPLTSADLTHGLTTDSIAADLAAGTISPDTGVIAIDFYQLAADERDNQQARIVDTYLNAGIQIRGQFAAETSENSFPRLPVYQEADAFIVISAYASEEDCEETQNKLLTSGLPFSSTIPSLRLSPTLRSPLRHLHA